jgi:hypothetical protein
VSRSAVCCAAWTPQRADAACHGMGKPHVARSVQILAVQIRSWATEPVVTQRVGIVYYVCRWVKMAVTSVGQANACGGEAKGVALPKRNVIVDWLMKSRALQKTTRAGDLMMGMAECNPPDIRRLAGRDVHKTFTLLAPSHLPAYSQGAS